ncbi:protein-methionine-sulfoxide reductase heme-binding subunit MsrQ [Cognatishimia sp. SS12]|uniref:protein-methionine-sulfoxide reductase heme-binding subunit MsrQ n=1 Tax=Cognatishimia sp. SS12 TaxID=2979465 RepID=UPI00232C4E14|nr:protein-methionine-sulfoxide reductase heme-binding subunit MsrQ [Cognatishimia sp. SS12]MDC0738042.1 protein-methionine-sulfoxide reductase heme-binding subunit MsrQ [Cognatishimia sp. SS12]
MTERLNQLLRKIPSGLIYTLGALYPAWLFGLALTGQLGVDPVKALEHQMGEAALQLLIAGLAITPLRQHLRLNLLKFRRAIGLLAFFYVLLHLLIWLVLDVQILGQIWADILKRPYITVGMAGFVLMLPLALTSNNLSLRKLGPHWRRLHRLTYVVAILGGLHFVMLVKGFQLTPLIYLGVILALLALRRVKPRPKAARRASAT